MLGNFVTFSALVFRKFKLDSIFIVYFGIACLFGGRFLDSGAGLGGAVMVRMDRHLLLCRGVGSFFPHTPRGQVEVR